MGRSQGRAEVWLICGSVQSDKQQTNSSFFRDVVLCESNCVIFPPPQGGDGEGERSMGSTLASKPGGALCRAFP